MLVRVLMSGAVTWAASGLFTGAPAAVIASVLVLGAAGWKARQAQIPGARH